MQDLVYSLDRRTSVPLKLVAYTAPERYPSDKPSWIWEAKTLDEVQGFHLAKSSTNTVYKYNKKGTQKVYIQDEFFVDKLIYDQKFPLTTFWPKPFQEGVNVVDGTLQKSSPPAPATNKTPVAGAPVAEVAVATPPSDWSTKSQRSEWGSA